MIIIQKNSSCTNFKAIYQSLTTEKLSISTFTFKNRNNSFYNTIETNTFSNMFINVIPLTHTHISDNVFLKQRYYNSPLIRKLDISWTDHSTDNEIKKPHNTFSLCYRLKSSSNELKCLL